MHLLSAPVRTPRKTWPACYELGASDMVGGRVEVDGDSMAGLAESDGVTSYPIDLRSFITMLNETVMKPCERTRVTTTATTAAAQTKFW